MFRKIHTSLPIFEVPWNDKIILYSPGKGIILQQPQEEEYLRLLSGESNSYYFFNSHKDLALIYKNAEKTMAHWYSVMNKTFKPECLTIYVSNDCNLNCKYCYSNVNRLNRNNSIINIEVVLLAAKIVAANCVKYNKPFILVLHGGGEPTFHWNIFVEIVNRVKKLIDEAGLDSFIYVATNGVIEVEKAKWLSQNINLVGLSCDGPDFINDAQRIGTIDGKLKETAKIIIGEGGKYDIRATITKRTIDKQEIIVDNLINKLKATQVRFEPEYLNSVDPFDEKDASVFVDNFLLAEEFASRNGAELKYSGVRINEIHNSYCDINRNSLRINPENQIINCFCDTPERKFPFGTINPFSKEIIFNNIQALKEKAYKITDKCSHCINIFHCSRGCPDYCSISVDPEWSKFRCQVNIRLAIEQIKKMVSSTSPNQKLR